VVLSLGRKEQRKNKLPARVVVYFVMALALFYGDGYEEVMRKLADGLRYLGAWCREWGVPTPGALCQARKRLGPEVMRKFYERVSVPCAMRSAKGAWLAGRRLMAIDGFGLEAPDSDENASYFGYAGKKGRSAFPFVCMPRLPSAARMRSSPRKSGRTGRASKPWLAVFFRAGRSDPE
jgi:Insertion element 4 transposase N-terminal